MIRSLILLLVMGCISINMHAAVVEGKSYDIYYGDLNSDGFSDYYFHGKVEILILHGSFITPIVISNPTGFAIYRNGSSYSSPQLYALTEAQILQRVTAGTLRLAIINADYYIWNNGNTTQSNVLLRGVDVTSPSILINSFAGVSLPLISQILPINSLANISDRSRAILLQDKNSDGKVDVIINGYVYLSDSGSGLGAPPVLISQTGPIITTYTYDSLGRLIISSSTDGSTNNYNLDAEDNRTSISSVKGI